MARSVWGFGSGGTRVADVSKHSSVAPPVSTPTPAAPSISVSKNFSLHTGGDIRSSQEDVAMEISGSSASPVDGESAGLLIPPSTNQIKGKLTVTFIEARDLKTDNANANPYVVCSCATSEHISPSATNQPAAANPSGIAIPRTSSRRTSTSLKANGQSSSSSGSGSGSSNGANPHWKDEAQFDVTSSENSISIIIYDAGNNDKILGQCEILPDFSTQRFIDRWYPLRGGPGSRSGPCGEVRVSVLFERTSRQHYGPSDFEVLRLIGRGTFGQVYQVRKKDTKRVYAMKVLSKRLIVQKKEIAHTIGERNILVRTSSTASNFLIALKLSFQTDSDLYLVTDYMSGGELFWHLQREGRFTEERAKFYIAELVVALEHLHDNGIIYRDLKPENILLDANGHIALCDFGLSKANLSNGTTNTFCGTTEYLAPEVLLDEKGYTKMVDFWSLGVLIFEMCCGWSPFYAEDNHQMYKNIAFGKVRFPKDALSPEGRDFVKGLLNRNPKHRLGAQNDARELKAHPFLKDIDWERFSSKQILPPFKPHVLSEEDTSNFDPEFTQASTSVLTRNGLSSTPLSPGVQAVFKGFTFVDETIDEQFRNLANNASYRPRNQLSVKEAAADGIELYDDKDIKLSESYYTNGIMNRFHGQQSQDADANFDEDEMMMRMDEETEDKLRGYDEFVSQGLEI